MLPVLVFLFVGFVLEGAFFSDVVKNYDNQATHEQDELINGIAWEFYKIIPANSYTSIETTVPTGSVFALIQVHSFLHNVTIVLSDQPVKAGRNIGVLVQLKEKLLNFNIQNNNKVDVIITGFVTTFNAEDILPGAGHSMTVISDPQVNLMESNHLTQISFMPAALPAISEASTLKYTLYYMYTPEKDYTIDTYFNAIKLMTTKMDMITEANQLNIVKDNSTGNITALVANYPGTGIIFNVVVEYENKSSIYVASHSFGCDYLANADSCSFVANTNSKVALVMLCVFGLVLGFCGYEWKSFELTVTAFFIACIPAYSLLYNILILEENIMVSIVLGFIFASGLVLALTYYDLVLVRHITAYLVFSCFIGCFVMFITGFGDCTMFKKYSIYWLTLSAITLPIFGLLFITHILSHIITSSTIGTFMVILTIDYFVGTSLKYIILDNIRRLTVDQFSVAYIIPPIQTPDILLVVVWISVCAISGVIQFYRRRKRFLRISQSANNNIPTWSYCSYDETSPLLGPDVFGGFISDY